MIVHQGTMTREEENHHREVQEIMRETGTTRAQVKGMFKRMHQRAGGHFQAQIASMYPYARGD